MTTGPDFYHVEQPFIDHLVRMGWKHTTDGHSHSSVTCRGSVGETTLIPGDANT